MKNVTLSAEEHLIDEARKVAQAQHKTLNQAFREWLADYTRRDYEAKAIEDLFARLSYVDSGPGKFTREELNER